MSLHYLSNDLFGQIIVFLATHDSITFVIGLTLLMAAMYVFVLSKHNSYHIEKWAFALLVVAAVVFGMSPLAREAHDTRLVKFKVKSQTRRVRLHKSNTVNLALT